MITALILNTFFLFAPLERPVLTVGQGYIESGHRTRAIGKAGERGAFQVRECIWGKVPRGWKKQADQAEDILNDLLTENHGCMNKAVTKYNGSGKKARIYQAKVFKKSIDIYLLDIA